MLSSPRATQQPYQHNPTIPDPAPCGRLGRIGTNSRNASDDVFTFGGVMDDIQRYRTDVATAETERRQGQRDRRSRRVEVRRNWLENLDTARWDAEARTKERADAMLAYKQGSSRLGISASGYNPITNTYAPTAEGTRLAERDKADMRQLSHRATTNYLRLNTFDPITGQDVLPPATAKSSLQFPRRPVGELIQRIVPDHPAPFREGFDAAVNEAKDGRLVGRGGGGGLQREGGKRRVQWL
ncbi:hypothetical protein HDU87_008659 [Geranomyces variabilis]|uniref:Uncharacterized protein n=1 Tax=Geranomyces variabilis TaxID=109894 RepID=A0AAD5TDW8_9FUNG|nr:hypothetical protein HDU87_008659 [Geranomyces variabilis]